MAGESTRLQGAWESSLDNVHILYLFTENHFCFIGEEEGRTPVEAGQPGDAEALALFRSMRAGGGPCRILEQEGSRLICEAKTEHARIPRAPANTLTFEVVFDGDDTVEVWSLNADRTRVEGTKQTWRRADV